MRGFIRIAIDRLHGLGAARKAASAVAFSSSPYLLSPSMGTVFSCHGRGWTPSNQRHGPKPDTRLCELLKTAASSLYLEKTEASSITLTRFLTPSLRDDATAPMGPASSSLSDKSGAKETVVSLNEITANRTPSCLSVSLPPGRDRLVVKIVNPEPCGEEPSPASPAGYSILPRRGRELGCVAGSESDSDSDADSASVSVSASSSASASASGSVPESESETESEPEPESGFKSVAAPTPGQASAPTPAPAPALGLGNTGDLVSRASSARSDSESVLRSAVDRRLPRPYSLPSCTGKSSPAKRSRQLNPAEAATPPSRPAFSVRLQILECTITHLLFLELYGLKLGQMSQAEFAAWARLAKMPNTAELYEVMRSEARTHPARRHLLAAENRFRVQITMGDCRPIGCPRTGPGNGEHGDYVRELHIYGQNRYTVCAAAHHIVNSLKKGNYSLVILPKSHLFSMLPEAVSVQHLRIRRSIIPRRHLMLRKNSQLFAKSEAFWRQTSPADRLSQVELNHPFFKLKNPTSATAGDSRRYVLSPGLRLN